MASTTEKMLLVGTILVSWKPACACPYLSSSSSVCCRLKPRTVSKVAQDGDCLKRYKTFRAPHATEQDSRDTGLKDWLTCARMSAHCSASRSWPSCWIIMCRSLAARALFRKSAVGLPLDVITACVHKPCVSDDAASGRTGRA